MADTKPAELTSPQDKQYAELLTQVTDAVEKNGTDLAAFGDKTTEEIKGQAAEIAKLSSQVEELGVNYAKRFAAMHEDVQHGRRPSDSPFARPEQARQFGLLCIMAAAKGMPEEAALARAELQKAAVQPTPGSSGGYLMPDVLVPGIVRNVEEAGVWERNCPAIPVEDFTGTNLLRTSGLTVYCRQFGSAPTSSDPAVGTRQFSLKVNSVLTYVDKWMLRSKLAITLGEFIAQEIGYALALKTDQNWFVGDGTSTSFGYTGLLNDTNILSYTPADDYDEFQEIIDVSSKCLARVLGASKDYVLNHPASKWFMHASVFFGFLGVRDTGGMPIATIYASGQKAQRALMGYPVEWVQAMPYVGHATLDGASKPMLLFGSLPLCARTFRHTGKIDLAISEHYKFPEGQMTFLADVPQDRTLIDDNAMCRLITHS